MLVQYDNTITALPRYRHCSINAAVDHSSRFANYLRKMQIVYECVDSLYFCLVEGAQLQKVSRARTQQNGTASEGRKEAI